MSKELLLNSSDHLSAVGILREALQILRRNGKLVVSIALFSLLSNCLLFLGNHFSIEPFLFDLVMNIFQLRTHQPDTPEYHTLVIAIKKDVGVLLGNELIIAVAMWVVFLFSMIATVYASAVTYSGKKATPKEVLTQTGRSWHGPAITWFYISLMSVGCSVLILIMFGVLTMIANGSIPLYSVMHYFPLVTLALFMVLLVLSVNLYLGMVWMVGVVVSVLEDGCYGMEALGKAEELMVGRKLQGYVVTLVLGLVLVLVSGFVGYEAGDVKISAKFGAGLHFMLTNIICLWKMYGAMVYTLLYFECKKIHGEEVKVQLGSGQRMFPTVPRFTATLA
ncbi:uncharacterized protein LOC122074228 [Macadamia integrifolia]|uniref:uncharacterized protein LOC122074228 n=1 Tax=Macadamia integrifolia TaxID=60698 RepID=UPI001C4FD2E2|nr:uncharacterized protein LOC122074228 [Macadamia integrifolia]